MQNALIPILITVSILIILFCLYRKKSCEESNENKENNENKDNNKNTVFDIRGLLIIAIIMPTIVWCGKYLLDGDAVFRRPYESGWLSFFGSYLGGLLGGIATLIAVVKTIQSNKEEQEHKEKIDKQKENQEAAFIMYYDFDFALDNIKGFLFEFWKMHETEKIIIDAPYNELKFDTEYYVYKECLVNLNQFYIDHDFIHTFAKLDPSLGIDTIRKIGEIYGHLSNIKRSMDVFDRITYKIAFGSMNSLVEIKDIDLTKGFSRDDFETEHNIKELMEKLKTIANIKKVTESKDMETDNKGTADANGDSENE